MVGIVKEIEKDDKGISYATIEVIQGAKKGERIYIQANNLMDVTGTYKVE